MMLSCAWARPSPRAATARCGLMVVARDLPHYCRALAIPQHRRAFSRSASAQYARFGSCHERRPSSSFGSSSWPVSRASSSSPSWGGHPQQQQLRLTRANHNHNHLGGSAEGQRGLSHLSTVAAADVPDVAPLEEGRNVFVR